MTHLMKKVSIAIMVAVFAATMCLPMLILPSKAYADSVPYAIGDIGPAGGIIFYVNGSSCLEAAPIDQSAGIVWITGGSTQTTWVNGVGYGGTSTAIGTGAANTTAIIAQAVAAGNNNPLTYAAGLARAYNGGGYSDWFLPSREELDQMYTNIANTPDKRTANGFVEYFYFSSSEVEADASHVWDKLMSNGAYGGPLKSEPLRVRAIRAFTGMKETGSALAINEKPLSDYDKTDSGFVTLLYNRILSRDPDAIGLANQTAALESGLTRMDLVNNFIFSEECQNTISGYSNEQFIKFLYTALFNREPDSGGLNNWLTHMSAGMTKEEVVNCFTHSLEFEFLY